MSAAEAGVNIYGDGFNISVWRYGATSHSRISKKRNNNEYRVLVFHLYYLKHVAGLFIVNAFLS